MIIAGEASGDLHGAALMRAMMNINPDLTFYGIGGDNMIEAGMHADFHIKEMAFLGFFEVIKHLPFIIGVKKSLIKRIEKENIEEVVLIDYPGFNLNFAGKAKKMGLKIFYYISPQIWAWGKKRIKKIKKLIDKMLVVFPFEYDFYKRAGVSVEYVGHPLIDRLENFSFQEKEPFYEKYGLSLKNDILVLMPGSREQEVNSIFAAMYETALQLSEKFNLTPVIACSGNIDESVFEQFNMPAKFKVIKGDIYNLLKHGKVGIIKSGTSTLEAALVGLPFAVVYKTSGITYEIGKRLIRVDNIAMPNIIAGKTIVREFIQHDANPENITTYIENLLNNSDLIEGIKSEFSEVRKILEKKGAAENAAKEVLKLIDES